MLPGWGKVKMSSGLIPFRLNTVVSGPGVAGECWSLNPGPRVQSAVGYVVTELGWIRMLQLYLDCHMGYWYGTLYDSPLILQTWMKVIPVKQIFRRPKISNHELHIIMCLLKQISCQCFQSQGWTRHPCGIDHQFKWRVWPAFPLSQPWPWPYWSIRKKERDSSKLEETFEGVPPDTRRHSRKDQKKKRSNNLCHKADRGVVATDSGEADRAEGGKRGREAWQRFRGKRGVCRGETSSFWIGFLLFSVGTLTDTCLDLPKRFIPSWIEVLITSAHCCFRRNPFISPTGICNIRSSKSIPGLLSVSHRTNEQFV